MLFTLTQRRWLPPRFGKLIKVTDMTNKTFVLLGSTLLTSQIYASQFKANLTPENQVLRAIDSVCGDAWCEGPYEYEFQQVSFDPERKSTNLQFRLIQDAESARFQIKESKDFSGQIKAMSYDLVCEIPGFADAESSLSSAYTLNHDFYRSLDACIQSLEKKVSRLSGY